MMTLSAWCFGRLDAAMGAERELAAMSDLGRLGVDDASLVFWPRTAEVPQMRAVGNVVQRRPLGQAFWGLVQGLVLAGPVLGGSGGEPGNLSEAGRGGGHRLADLPLSCCLGEVGVEGQFIGELRSGLVRGSSALLTVTELPIGPEVAVRLGGGPTIESRLSDRHEANLCRVFGV